MTIFNQINNVSEDYTYIIDRSEVFFDFWDIAENDELIIPWFLDGEWTELTANEDMYNRILDIVSDNPDVKPALLDREDDFLELDPTKTVYHGIISDQTNLPDIPENTYIALINIDRVNIWGNQGQAVEALADPSEHAEFIPDPEYLCIPIKSLLLSSQVQIGKLDGEYEPNDREYLSSKQIYNMMSRKQSGTSIVTLNVKTSDLRRYGPDVSGTTLFSYFSLSNNNYDVTNPDVIYKIRITYDEPLGTLGEYYLGSVVTRFFIYVYDGEGPAFISFGLEEEDISIMIDEKIGNIEEDMLS